MSDAACSENAYTVNRYHLNPGPFEQGSSYYEVLENVLEGCVNGCWRECSCVYEGSAVYWWGC